MHRDRSFSFVGIAEKCGVRPEMRADAGAKMGDFLPKTGDPPHICGRMGAFLPSKGRLKFFKFFRKIITKGIEMNPVLMYNIYSG